MAVEKKQINSRVSDEVGSRNETRNQPTDSSAKYDSRSLPPGKLYHVFFSHCYEDREWVKEMVDKLESPEYGFKCCYADRDFDLGIPVFQNITKCIHTSKRTVIVMSPEFLQSPWCSYETRITLELDLDTRQRLLIPVMLRHCKVPQYIGRLSYMEVENEHFWERFVAAIAEDDSFTSVIPANVGSDAIMACIPFQFNPYFHSTDEIVEVTVYRGCDYCPVSVAEFMPNELMRHGIQVTPSEYREIVTAIIRVFYVRCHGFFSKPLYLASIILALITVVITASLCLALREYIIGSIALSFILLIVLLITFYNACRMKATNSLSKALEFGNRISHTRNLMVTVKEYGWCSCTCDKISMIFYYYDWRPCHSHLTIFLTEQYRTTNEEIPYNFRDNASLLDQQEATSTTIQTEAWDLLVKHSTEYCQLLLNRRSVTPSEQRHTRQGECLCQFVESILVSGETSCCDCIFGVRSRHPWRRYCFL